MKPYRPSIRSLQLEFAQRLARKRMLAKIREKNPHPEKKILDNSEPFVKDPDSIDDFIEISRRARASEERWRKRFSTSSIS